MFFLKYLLKIFFKNLTMILSTVYVAFEPRHLYLFSFFGNFFFFAFGLVKLASYVEDTLTQLNVKPVVTSRTFSFVFI